MKVSFPTLRFPALWLALLLPAGLWAQPAPSFSKAFGAAQIPLGGSTRLSFFLTDTVDEAVPAVGFTDTLPAGLVISTPNGLAAACFTGTITATQGSNSVSLSGALLPGDSSCAFSVNVTSTSAGVKNNTSGPVTCSCPGSGGSGGTASASVTVVAPPTITKSFGADSIPLSGATSLSFAVTNPNATASLSGVAFSDTLPTGLVVATPSNGLTGSCGTGTITAAAGSGSVSLSGGTLAASASCTFAVNVTGSTSGTKNNTTSTISSTEGGAGGTASASLTVNSPSAPTISELFGAANIQVGATTSLSFTVTNPNATASLTGVGFTDTLPSGLAIATPNGLTGSCGGGTITATAASGSVSLSGATLAANTSCTFSVTVTGTAAGTKNNTTGTVSSNEGGTGGTASANLVVQAATTTVPVLSPGALAGLALLLAGMGWVLVSRQRTRPNV
jgi:hypothetical protein